VPKYKTVSSRRFRNCPNTILTAQHYDDGDDSCHCFKRDAKEMEGLGYRWSKRKKRWV
jgi:hypothetical protein